MIEVAATLVIGLIVLAYLPFIGLVAVLAVLAAAFFYGAVTAGIWPVILYIVFAFALIRLAIWDHDRRWKKQWANKKKDDT